MVDLIILPLSINGALGYLSILLQHNSGFGQELSI